MAVLEYPELMTRKQAAEFLGVREQTLAAWATAGRYGLRFFKAGRSVRYAKSDLDQFLAARSGTSTAAIANAKA